MTIGIKLEHSQTDLDKTNSW